MIVFNFNCGFLFIYSKIMSDHFGTATFYGFNLIKSNLKIIKGETNNLK